MKKFLSMLSFAMIMFVASTVAHADPYIQAEITSIDFRPGSNQIVLYMTLYNTGDRRAEVTALHVHSLNIYDTNGNLLWSDSVNFNNPSNCYIEAGYHISNVPFTIIQTRAPAYYGRTTYNWNYTAYWRTY